LKTWILSQLLMIQIILTILIIKIETNRKYFFFYKEVLFFSSL